MYQTVEMANGYWLVFRMSDGFEVACCYSKTVAVGLVRYFNHGS